MPIAPNSPHARDVAYVLHPYTNLPVHEEKGPLIIERGEGVHVIDLEGKRYIEGLAGLWCTALGYSEERLIKAAADQMRKMPFYHTFASRSTNPMIDLAEKLLSMLPVKMSKVFFANSGSEANDTIVKLVWYYNNAVGRPQKKKIIARLKGYHGVTVAAGSLTGLPYAQKGFDLPIANILHTDCPHHYRFAKPGESEEDFATRMADNLDALIQREGPDTVAAFIAEPVMGAGGVIVPPRTYFEKVQKVLAKHDVMLIADEVICGFGRTGNMFGTETFGLKPDFMTFAKQLSSSYLPISAVAVSERVYQQVKKLSGELGVFGTGYTYSGHPVCAAVALETLKIYEERDTVGHVRKVSKRFQARLKGLGSHPLVGEARGVGLIGALELVADKGTSRGFDAARKVAAFAAERAAEHGLLIRPLVGDALAFCPPLIITEAEVDQMFDATTRALDDTLAWVEKENLRAA